MRDLRIEVVEVKGFCDLPMRPGDYFELRGGRLYIPDGGYVCMWALAAILPMLPAKQRARDDPNDWLPRVELLACPDPDGQVIYRISELGAGPRPPHPPRMLVDETACSGCRSCELACSWQKTGAFDPEAARIRVEKEERVGRDRPLVCRQCGTAACVRACPAGALSRHPLTRAVLVDTTRCQGCGACAQACPFAAIRVCAGKAVVCDLCGGAPACVERCVTGALRYGGRGGRRF